MLIPATELRINMLSFEGSTPAHRYKLGLREKGFTATMLLALEYRNDSYFFHDSQVAPADEAALYIIQTTRLSRQFTNSLAKDSL